MRVIRVVATTQAAAISAGEAITSVMSIKPAVRSEGGSSVLESIVLFDASNQKKDMTLLFFGSDPTTADGGAATVTINSAFAWGTSHAHFLGRVEIEDTDYQTLDSKANATLKNIGLSVYNTDTTNKIYCVAVADETITPTATTDLAFTFGFLQGD